MRWGTLKKKIKRFLAYLLALARWLIRLFKELPKTPPY